MFEPTVQIKNKMTKESTARETLSDTRLAGSSRPGRS
ncbi:uncharacterized protein PgNI_04206 [Pyricularia grisea]|uniref:Uncharacterized protein n=1 Tax=Pyricularia grisea TaxID=148305 RepID=A0A6P8BFE2_PYRGI|nr:uncharacterized protein PgNI_04206 [Pyricularia grisea]TLD14437.1 hypothetical protein PgNI_04206 [Pyricularia grisea]